MTLNKVLWPTDLSMIRTGYSIWFQLHGSFSSAGLPGFTRPQIALTSAGDPSNGTLGPFVGVSGY